MLGKSVAELDSLTPSEYLAWEDLIRRYPPVELEVKRMQFILADTWALLHTFVSGWTKNPKTHHPKEAAPWLFPDEENTAEETEDEIRARRLALARQLHGK